jgi:hypothetical protein
MVPAAEQPRIPPAPLLAVMYGIAEAANGADDGIVAVAVDLQPEVPDIHINDL